MQKLPDNTSVAWTPRRHTFADSIVSAPLFLIISTQENGEDISRS